jgi:ankyrin repeat protein
MNHKFTLIFLTVIGTTINMEKPQKPDSKSHIVRPTRLKGSIISPAVPRHQSSKELYQSANQKIGPELMAAIHDDEYSRVKELLLIKGSAANYVSSQQETPLYAALTANKYNHKIFAKLLAHHADLNRPVKDKTPFELALQRNNPRAALRLIYTGANVHEEKKKELLAQELFYQLTRTKEKMKIEHLLGYFESLNIHATTNISNNTGDNDTPLLCTIKEPKNFNETAFEKVLEKSDVNFCARNGLSPLYKAILFDNENVALRLLMEEAHYEYAMPFFQGKSLSVLELAEQMKMKRVIQTIQQLAQQANAARTVDKDALVAQLVRQTTPRRTKSPRETVQKP